jgi:hypothetical protein
MNQINERRKVKKFPTNISNEVEQVENVYNQSITAEEYVTDVKNQSRKEGYRSNTISEKRKKKRYITVTDT